MKHKSSIRLYAPCFEGSGITWGEQSAGYAVKNKGSDSVTEFNRRSRTYETSWEQWLIFDRVHRIVLDFAKEIDPGCVLDIGCGTGRLLRKAGECWPSAQLIGVDHAEGMVERARSLTPNATFHLSSAESLPLPDSYVDLAFSTLSFHHWSNQRQAVKQVARVLRPGGHFVLADISPPLGIWKIVRHFQTNSPSRIREKFEFAGLTVVTQKRFLGRFLLVTLGERRMDDPSSISMDYPHD